MDTRVKAVEFNEEEHRYFYNGKELHGVTRSIGKILGKEFPDNEVVQLATIYGHDVHKESELWITERKEPSSEAGKWVVKTLREFMADHGVHKYEAELIVSDFEGTASCIDIVAHTDTGAYLFDIKTTSKFDRAYCSMQLNTYKKLYEQCYEDTVRGMYVISTKNRRLFNILTTGYEFSVGKILQMNKEM